ncbi:MAG: hypothetical protein LBF38_00390 [Deltaproteobacteria bacterium]|jgi:carbonic anhydrase|nr:hypothetical protein [Deltaproteobacteria bacterium]
MFESFKIFIEDLLVNKFFFVALLPIVALFSGPALAADAGHDLDNPNSIESTIKALRDGNARFAGAQPTHPNQTKDRLKTLADQGQTPMAAVLACSDSRVPVEELFDLGFGDLFVVRAAGAVPGVDQVGSLEYAVAHLGVPVILVLSHTECGAVSAAVTGADEPGALGQLLVKLTPVAKAVESIDQARQLQTAVELSAVIFREQLPLVSPVINQAVRSGKLLIISGVYDLASGKVDLTLPKGYGPSPQNGAPPEALEGKAPEPSPDSPEPAAPAAPAALSDSPSDTSPGQLPPTTAVTLPAPAPNFDPPADTPADSNSDSASDAATDAPGEAPADSNSEPLNLYEPPVRPGEAPESDPITPAGDAQ